MHLIECVERGLGWTNEIETSNDLQYEPKRTQINTWQTQT